MLPIQIIMTVIDSMIMLLLAACTYAPDNDGITKYVLSFLCISMALNIAVIWL